MKTYEFSIPFEGVGFIRIEAENLAEANQRLLNEKPEFDTTVYNFIDYYEALLERTLDAE